ncbi:Zn-dependent peptidase ImmA, M78 family [Chitinasiproducens palmae]|uniref:Zn-dependent peptidase ImmA, M78 family n=2 Tax=Chitinasiproducens palmae TaxID=1770053 RepID=A0A1H2PS52_9BURK|nr:Zn-dependent peptidase ImmA, M78 family [Chitinasiproducens palmae]
MFENGKKSPSSETLLAIAKSLSVPTSYLLSEVSRPDLSGVTHFRKLEAATKRDRAKYAVRERWIADLLATLRCHLDLPKVNVPDFNVTDFDRLTNDDIEDLADATRRTWGLGSGPISNVTMLFENNGIVVARIPLSANVDAFSCWQGELPIVIIGSKLPFVRGRFDCGHELGHLILHKAVTQEHLADKDTFRLIEQQAHLFGAALLVPRASLAKELYSISIDALLELKRRWGVSMQALLYRAHKLELISYNQYQYAFRQISAAGYRRIEPLDREIPVERPTMLSRAIHLVTDNGILKSDEFCELLSLFPEDLAEISGVTADFFTRKDVVVPLTLKFG